MYLLRVKIEKSLKLKCSGENVSITAQLTTRPNSKHNVMMTYGATCRNDSTSSWHHETCQAHEEKINYLRATKSGHAALGGWPDLGEITPMPDRSLA